MSLTDLCPICHRAYGEPNAECAVVHVRAPEPEPRPSAPRCRHRGPDGSSCGEPRNRHSHLDLLHTFKGPAEPRPEPGEARTGKCGHPIDSFGVCETCDMPPRAAVPREPSCEHGVPHSTYCSTCYVGTMSVQGEPVGEAPTAEEIADMEAARREYDPAVGEREEGERKRREPKMALSDFTNTYQPGTVSPIEERWPTVREAFVRGYYTGWEDGEDHKIFGPYAAFDAWGLESVRATPAPREEALRMLGFSLLGVLNLADEDRDEELRAEYGNLGLDVIRRFRAALASLPKDELREALAELVEAADDMAIYLPGVSSIAIAGKCKVCGGFTSQAARVYCDEHEEIGAQRFGNAIERARALSATPESR